LQQYAADRSNIHSLPIVLWKFLEGVMFADTQLKKRSAQMERC